MPPETTPCPILAAQKAQADEARAILRRRLGPNPAYDAAVAAWIERNRNVTLGIGLASSTREMAGLTWRAQ